MLAEDVVRLAVFQDQKTEQVNQGQLVFLLSLLRHLNQLIDRLWRALLQVKCLQPFVEILSSFGAASNEFLDEHLHLIRIISRRKTNRHQVHRAELLEFH